MMIHPLPFQKKLQKLRHGYNNVQSKNEKKSILFRNPESRSLQKDDRVDFLCADFSLYVVVVREARVSLAWLMRSRWISCWLLAAASRILSLARGDESKPGILRKRNVCVYVRRVKRGYLLKKGIKNEES